ncbi:hypothetical protein [Nocardia suismassiliense]|nr:hypothetical protein [Nocardia suismassiliense]
MDLLVILVGLAIGATIVWGATSFCAEGVYRRNHSDRTPHGDDKGGR